GGRGGRRSVPCSVPPGRRGVKRRTGQVPWSQPRGVGSPYRPRYGRSRDEGGTAGAFEREKNALRRAPRLGAAGARVVAVPEPPVVGVLPAGANATTTAVGDRGGASSAALAGAGLAAAALASASRCSLRVYCACSAWPATKPCASS